MKESSNDLGLVEKDWRKGLVMAVGAIGKPTHSVCVDYMKEKREKKKRSACDGKEVQKDEANSESKPAALPRQLRK